MIKIFIYSVFIIIIIHTILEYFNFNYFFFFNTKPEKVILDKNDIETTKMIEDIDSSINDLENTLNEFKTLSIVDSSNNELRD